MLSIFLQLSGRKQNHHTNKSGITTKTTEHCCNSQIRHMPSSNYRPPLPHVSVKGGYATVHFCSVQSTMLSSVVQSKVLTCVVQFKMLTCVVQFKMLSCVVQSKMLTCVVQFKMLSYAVQFKMLSCVVQFKMLSCKMLSCVVQFKMLSLLSSPRC